MSYEVFARKYRPQTFDDVVGQEHITRTLRNAIEHNRLAHAYIFVGPRGTGKTSTARILAKSLNCQRSDKPTAHPCGECDACREIAAGNSLDVLEFDAASNTQVDKVRDLIIDNVKYAPTRGRYKVYLVDEVHMLSTNSFNALLKTLEEPPAHVKFIFATTDVQKVPTTILSRCQRFDLKRIPTGLIASHLLGIAEHEKIALAPTAAEAIARAAEGGMRDAESMLDQLVAFCGQTIAEDDVLSVFGLTGQQTVSSLCNAMVDGEVATALGIVHEQAEAGRDLSRLMSDLIAHLRNVLVAQADPAGLSGELSPEAVAGLVEEAGRIRTDKLLDLIEQLGAAEGRMRWAPNRKMHFEIAVIRATQTLAQATLGEVLETLTAMRGGNPLPPATAAAPKPPRSTPPTPRATTTATPPITASKVAAPKPKTTVAAPTPDAPLPSAAESTPPTAATSASEPAAATPEPEPSAIPAASAPVATAPTEPPPATASAVSVPTEPAVESETSPAAAPLDVTPPDLEPAPSPVVAESAAELNPAQVWTQVVEQVKAKRPLIRLWVESARLESASGGKALLVFPKEQSIAADYIQQPNHKEFLEGVLSEIAGSPLSLKVDLREGLTPPPASTGASVSTPSADPAADFKNDPLIQKALELFRAEIHPA